MVYLPKYKQAGESSRILSCHHLLLFVLILTLALVIPATNAQGPPEGLFEQLDTNHDELINHDEYNQGWGLIQDALRESGALEANHDSNNANNANNANSNGSGPSSFSFLSSWLPTYQGGFWKGFSSGVAMILATEIGDKTFFIAAVLSMRQERSAVFAGAILSLYIMTVLSAVMGLVLPTFLSPKYTHIFGGLLFLYFGIKLLLDSRGMEANRVSEELEEVEEELLHPKKTDDNDEEKGGGGGNNKRISKSDSNNSDRDNNSDNNDNYFSRLNFTQVAMQSFTLTFVAEWGDRSQIATIALAAAKNPYGVTLGGCVGHTMCTGLAVLGGRMLAARISEKTVSLFGGIIFLLFGIHSLFFES